MIKQILRWLRSHKLAPKRYQPNRHSLKSRSFNRPVNQPTSKRSAHAFAAKVQALPAAVIPDASSKIIYAVSRAEAIAALNQSLHRSLPPSHTPVSVDPAADPANSAFTGAIAAKPRSPRPLKPTLRPINAAAPIAPVAIEPDSGEPHQDLTASTIDAAYLCECQGRYAEAEHLYQRALTAIRRQLALSQAVPNSADREFSVLALEITLEGRYAALISGLEDLAGLYYRLKRYQNVLPLLEESLAIRQQQQLTHSADLGEKLYQLADAYRHQAMYGKAELMFQRSLDLLREQLGLQHPRTQAVYGEFIQMLATVIECGQFDELSSDLPPLDLDHLSDRYSWAKPAWQQS